jgi:hypothetical protein
MLPPCLMLAVPIVSTMGNFATFSLFSLSSGASKQWLWSKLGPFALPYSGMS